MIAPFPKIFALGTDYIKDIFKEPVQITEKIDGCFDYNSPVILADGSRRKIGEIVNNRMNVDVLSMSEDGTIEAKPVIGWHKNGNCKEWLKITMPATHGQVITLRCTPSHQLLSEKGWIRADNVQAAKTRLLRRASYTSKIQRQMLFGTLLGDACISGGRLASGHSEAQSEYVDLKFNILRSIGLRRDIRTSGYGSTILRIHSGITTLTKEIATICLDESGVKRIDDKWLRELTPLSLAFWYMDDGSVSIGDKQRGYAVLHTNGFPLEDVQRLKCYLSSQFNIVASIRDNKGPYLALDTDSTDLLFSLIFPFVPPSMQYKLWPEYRNGNSVWEGFQYDREKSCIEAKEVISVESFQPSNPTKYDIEVADNHNFLVSDYIVHNSQFSFGKIDGQVYIRSKGAQLHINNPEGMFSKAVSYIEQISHLLPEGMVFYTEYLRTPKHNTLKYDRVPKNNLMLFGAFFLSNNSDMHTSQFFNENSRAYADLLEIEHVPVLYKGKINSASELNVLMNRTSVLGGPNIEGLVVKNYQRKFLLGGQTIPIMAGKLVSESFKEVHRKRWGTEEKSKSRLETFMESFRTEARWEKAVQHLQEKGELDNEPSDIGKLIKEIQTDIESEEMEAIKDWLYKEFKGELMRKATKKFPEWYKTKLLEQSFQ